MSLHMSLISGDGDLQLHPHTHHNAPTCILVPSRCPANLTMAGLLRPESLSVMDLRHPITIRRYLDFRLVARRYRRLPYNFHHLPCVLDNHLPSYSSRYLNDLPSFLLGL